MFRKATVVMILITLALASFPTASVLAKGVQTEKLEAKWDQLVTNYERQSLTHNSVHNWADQILLDKDASASKKEDVAWHLNICNSALASAATVVGKHAGFDGNGKVIDRALAIKSIRDLSFYLRQHAGSVKNLREHLN